MTLRAAALVSIVIAGIMIGSLTASNWAAATPPPGEVNCDGAVNSIDATLILQYDAGLVGSLCMLSNADVSADGRINAIDASLVLQFTAGLIDSLGPPAIKSPAPTQTRTPTTTPTLAPQCSPWPPEVAAVLERLPVVDGFCLVRIPGSSQSAYYDSNIPAAVCASGCSPHGSEALGLIHEACHSHQHQVVLDAGVPANFKVGWGKDQIHPQDDAFGLAYPQQTPEGQAFLELGTWGSKNGEWIQILEPGWPGAGDLNPFEASANACWAWYYERERFQNDAPIQYQWASKWLVP